MDTIPQKSSCTRELKYSPDRVLRNIHDIKIDYESNYSCKSRKAKGMFITFASLELIERMIAEENKDFAGNLDFCKGNGDRELSTLIGIPDELLRDWRNVGYISKMKYAYTMYMKGLISQYESRKIKDSDGLILGILSAIDKGVEEPTVVSNVEEHTSKEINNNVNGSSQRTWYCIESDSVGHLADKYETICTTQKKGTYKILKGIYDVKKDYESNHSREAREVKGMYLAFATLSMVAQNVHEVKELKALISWPDEQLKGLRTSGYITKTDYAYTMHMKGLVAKYASRKIKDSDGLIREILSAIDRGVGEPSAVSVMKEDALAEVNNNASGNLQRAWYSLESNKVGNLLDRYIRLCSEENKKACRDDR